MRVMQLLAAAGEGGGGGKKNPPGAATGNNSLTGANTRNHKTLYKDHLILRVLMTSVYL